MSNQQSVITLSYGNFTCSFTRSAEEEALTQAVISQIAEIVKVNPSFGYGAPASENAAPEPVLKAPAAEHPPLRQMPVPEPVSDPMSETQDPSHRFDSEDGAVSFMRSPNAPAHGSEADAEIAERYDALREAVIRMLSDASEALEALEPLRREPAPNIPAPELAAASEAPVEQEPMVAEESDAAPDLDDVLGLDAPIPPASFDQQEAEEVVRAELAPDNETTVFRLIPTN